MKKLLVLALLLMFGLNPVQAQKTSTKSKETTTQSTATTQTKRGRTVISESARVVKKGGTSDASSKAGEKAAEKK